MGRLSETLSNAATTRKNPNLIQNLSTNTVKKKVTLSRQKDRQADKIGKVWDEIYFSLGHI
jgi:hypothetical protein